MYLTELLLRSLAGLFLQSSVLHSRSGDEQWFDAYDAKQTAYPAWCRACSADHWGPVFARAEARGRVDYLSFFDYLSPFCFFDN